MESTISEVRRLTEGWRAAPAVHVVESHRELPLPADEACEAMYHRGQVFITHRESRERVAQLVGHEVLAHHGLRTLLGRERWTEFMRAVDDGARAGDRLLLALQREVRASYGDLPPGIAADESAALLVELRMDAAAGRLAVKRPLQKRLRAAAAQAAREFLYLEVAANADELEGTLLEAEALLRNGPDGLLPGMGRWYRAAMPAKPMGPRIPARSLAESESMMAAEAHRLNSPGEWKMVGTFASAVGGAFMAAAGIGYLLLLVLGVVHI